MYVTSPASISDPASGSATTPARAHATSCVVRGGPGGCDPLFCKTLAARASPMLVHRPPWPWRGGDCAYQDVLGFSRNVLLRILSPPTSRALLAPWASTLRRPAAWSGLIMMWRMPCAFSYILAPSVYTSDVIPTARVLVRSRIDRVSFGLVLSMRVGARLEDIALSLQRVKCASKPMC